MTTTITRHYYLSGTVQGVWCRDFVIRESRSRGITGWVRNRRDGRVEIIAQGAKDTLSELEAQLHVGPPLASIESIQSETIAGSDEVYFEFEQKQTV